MKKSLMEVLIAEISSEIKLTVANGRKYCFTAVRDNVMRRHSKEISGEWRAYSKALSSHYSLLGVKAACKLRMERGILRELRIQEAEEFALAEREHLGGPRYDEESGCIFGLGEFELDEAI